MRSALVLTSLSFVLACLAACGGAVEDHNTGELGTSVGHLGARVVDVPQDVKCVQFYLDGALTKQVGAAGLGEVRLGSLRVGRHSLSATAYDAECNGAGGNNEYTWSSPTKTVEIVAGKTTTITVVMRRNSTSNANATICFLEEGEDESHCGSNSPATGDVHGSLDAGADTAAYDDAGHVLLPEAGDAAGLDANHDVVSPPSDLATWPVSGMDAAQRFVLGVNTTTDNLTGLVWGRFGSETTMTHSRASSHCAGLRLDDHNGWRLPTRMELMTIADMSRNSKSPTWLEFPDAFRKNYWTSTVRARSQFSTVYYAMGINNNLFKFHNASTEFDQEHVRCVRSTRPAPATEHYTIDNDVVTDNWTGLQWQRNASERLPLESNAYCSTLDRKGGGWRQPTIQELFTLVDPNRNSPAIDTQAFPATSTGDATAETMFWSSTRYSDIYMDGVWGYGVWFGDGSVRAQGLGAAHYIRCVRDAR